MHTKYSILKLLRQLGHLSRWYSSGRRNDLSDSQTKRLCCCWKKEWRSLSNNHCCLHSIVVLMCHFLFLHRMLMSLSNYTSRLDRICLWWYSLIRLLLVMLLVLLFLFVIMYMYLTYTNYMHYILYRHLF